MIFSELLDARAMKGYIFACRRFEAWPFMAVHTADYRQQAGGIMTSRGSGSCGVLGEFGKEADSIWKEYLNGLNGVHPQKSTVCQPVICQFQTEADAVWAVLVDDTHLREFSLSDRIVRVVERTRFPVTQEFMVAAIVAERRGESPPHPAKQYFADALHQSIERMIGMIASKYTISCVESHDDLAQDCFSRIWRKLDKFDAGRAKFSTWSWKLCANLLNRKYRRSQKRKKRESIEPFEEVERKGFEDKHYDSILSREFSNVVRQLRNKYPKWESFICALLGDPDRGIIPRGICVARAATTAGVGKGTAMYFYHKRVVPFLRKRFA